MENSILERLIDFLHSVTGHQNLNATAGLLDSGLLDSLTMMDLLVFVESEFDLRLDFQDIQPDFFETPSTIAELIDNRLAIKSQAELI
ncbi:MAG: hypothetical protein K0U86_08310 [Planctomycetes bacterium]|nr:hypothetical protein [Planctomycetota bacterium]MCH9724892.1 hypothetical protein [Planctomycetota bacterium]MCH9776851.1 hypothetical protein [Planctomycetota bacterium]MCH9792222.1 hypothetical protein [Planctomycetota bacterium]MDF1743816.1 phosphopantetheine-binding protein [Gimesia sp.]